MSESPAKSKETNKKKQSKTKTNKQTFVKVSWTYPAARESSRAKYIFQKQTKTIKTINKQTNKPVSKWAGHIGRLKSRAEPNLQLDSLFPFLDGDGDDDDDDDDDDEDGEKYNDDEDKDEEDDDDDHQLLQCGDDQEEEEEDEDDDNGYQFLQASSQISLFLSSGRKVQCRLKQEAPFWNIFSFW